MGRDTLPALQTANRVAVVATHPLAGVRQAMRRPACKQGMLCLIELDELPGSRAQQGLMHSIARAEQRLLAGKARRWPLVLRAGDHLFTQ